VRAPTSLSIIAALVIVTVIPASARRMSPQANLASLLQDKRKAGTRALGIYRLNDSAPIVEDYAPGYSAKNRFVSWSMAKSITSTAIGILVDSGKLQLDAPAPVPAWRRQNDPRGKITLRQLLNMSSGLKQDEGASKTVPIEKADTPRFLFGDAAGNAVSYITAKPLEVPPGAAYKYSTATSIILGDIVSRIITSETKPEKRTAIMAAWLQENVFRATGMNNAVAEFDAAGNYLGGSFVHAPLSDWANFGLTYLRNGMGPTGKIVVSKKWVDFVRTSAPTEGGYGGHFWLNKPRTTQYGKTHPALFPEKGPADAYAAIGHLGQYVIIVPSKQIVVVRLGKNYEADLQQTRDWLGDIINSFPDVPPQK
jgi:CubicO group peptidase (beta-lactamase class C family)